MSDQMKQCTKCGELKSLELFNNDKRRRDGRGSWCRNCTNLHSKQWAETPIGQAKTKARSAKWYREHTERHLQQGTANRQANPEPSRAATRRWKLRNLERRLAYEKEHYARNLEYYRTKAKAYQHANPLKYREYCARRYARILGNGYEKVSYAQIAGRDNWTCYLCGQKISPNDLNIDHVIPLCEGGPHQKSNLRATHRECNQRKGRKLMEVTDGGNI